MATVIQPPTLGAANGYSNGLLFERGKLLFVAGQIGWDAEGRFEEGLVAQFDRALANVLAVVESAGGSAQSIGRLTLYIVDKRDYLANTRAIGQCYRARMGRHFPAMSLVQVAALLEDRALIEIEATAVLGEELP